MPVELVGSLPVSLPICFGFHGGNPAEFLSFILFLVASFGQYCFYITQNYRPYKPMKFKNVTSPKYLTLTLILPF